MPAKQYLVNLTLEEREHLLNLALNRISGTWDQELLARLLADLNAVPDVDLSLTGFSEDELQKHLKSWNHVRGGNAWRHSTWKGPWKRHGRRPWLVQAMFGALL